MNPSPMSNECIKGHFSAEKTLEQSNRYSHKFIQSKTLYSSIPTSRESFLIQFATVFFWVRS